MRMGRSSTCACLGYFRILISLAITISLVFLYLWTVGPTGSMHPKASSGGAGNRTNRQPNAIQSFNDDAARQNTSFFSTTIADRNSTDENRDPPTGHVATASMSSVSNGNSRNFSSVTSNAKKTGRPGNVADYVTFVARSFNDGRGVGNQLFDLAAMLYVCAATGRRPAFYASTGRPAIDDVFELNVERFDDLSPCHVLSDRRHLAFDAHLLDGLILSDNQPTPAANTSLTDVRNKSLSLSGYFISWKYVDVVKTRLHPQLIFRRNIRTSVDRFLRDNVPTGWTAVAHSSAAAGRRDSSSRGFVRVGIHVRRGDFLTPGGIEYGYTVPSAGYFQRAMRHFLLQAQNDTGRVQFIVCSNDMKWSRENIASITEFQSNSSDSATTNSPPIQSVYNITYSSFSTAGEDLALLTSCDHVIMSVGTYGWWAAWLAGGTTVYYADYPRKGSALYVNHFVHDDFFPSNWIGMT